MGIPVLIIGKSGGRKSASMKRCIDKFSLVRVLNKPLLSKGRLTDGSRTSTRYYTKR
ncbi:MAG: hypothetical protein ACLVKR_04755 [Lachnospiraceae bacterium]